MQNSGNIRYLLSYNIRQLWWHHHIKVRKNLLSMRHGCPVCPSLYSFTLKHLYPLTPVLSVSIPVCLCWGFVICFQMNETRWIHRCFVYLPWFAICYHLSSTVAVPGALLDNGVCGCNNNTDTRHFSVLQYWLIKKWPQISEISGPSLDLDWPLIRTCIYT